MGAAVGIVLLAVVTAAAALAGGMAVGRRLGHAAGLREGDAALRGAEERAAAAGADAAAVRAELSEVRRSRDAAEAARLVAERELAGARTEIDVTSRSLDEQRRLLGETRAELSNTFSALAAQALEQSSKQFLTLADQTLTRERTAAGEAVREVVTPIKTTLAEMSEHVRTIEMTRGEQYAALTTQMTSLSELHTTLSADTRSLRNALARPEVRGRWGESTLRRVMELAGMVEHCDFVEQASITADGTTLRPDVLIELPQRRRIVVDAKAPLDAYLAAYEATDEAARAREMARFSAHVRKHVEQLAQKEYWAQFGDDSPEFVVLFLPGEAFFAAALAADTGLLEFAAARKVILTNPVTLIATLRTVAAVWREERLAENVEKASQLGRTLYQRLVTAAGHLTKLGTQLESTTKTYNEFVASFDSRVLATARQFPELGVGTDKTLPEVHEVELTPRAFTSREVIDAATDGSAAAAEAAAEVLNAEVLDLTPPRDRERRSS